MLKQQQNILDKIFKNYNPKIKVITTNDGRIDSIKNETSFIEDLEKYLKINFPNVILEKVPIRFWCDFYLILPEFPGIKIPINLKLTDFKSGDNFSGIAPLIHCFTDYDVIGAPRKPGKDKTFSKKVVCKILDKLCSEKETNKDYYLLVIEKSTNNVIFTSLRHLNKLRSNPANPPFQIYWSDNLLPIQRSYIDSKNYILGQYQESLEKRFFSDKNLINVLKKLKK